MAGDENTTDSARTGRTGVADAALAATVGYAIAGCDRSRNAMTKIARVYKIEMLIRNLGHVSFQGLLHELQVSSASLKRDTDHLKDPLGASIEYDPCLNGYRRGERYRDEKHELPGLWFTERELYSLLMANQLLSDLRSEGVLSRQLQLLLDRIPQLLGIREGEANALPKRIKIISSATRPLSSHYFELIGDALLKRKRLERRYLTRGRREVEERKVSPQRLVRYRNTRYLDARCHTREKLLRSAPDTVESAETLLTKAKEIYLKHVEASMDVGYGIYAVAKLQWVTLVFRPQASKWVSRMQWPLQTGKWLLAGGCELQMSYADATELALNVLRPGAQVVVASPKRFRDLVTSGLSSVLGRSHPGAKQTTDRSARAPARLLVHQRKTEMLSLLAGNKS